MPTVTEKPKTYTQAEYDQLLALVRQKEEEVKQAKLAAINSIRFEIAPKGGIMVKGLNAQFPVTLYAGQWFRLFEKIPALKEYIQAALDKGWAAKDKSDEKNYTDEQLDAMNGSNRVERKAAKEAATNGTNGQAAPAGIDLTPAEIAQLEKRVDLSEQEQAVLNTAKLRLKLRSGR